MYLKEDHKILTLPNIKLMMNKFHRILMVLIHKYF